MADTTQKCVLCNHLGLCIIQGSGKVRVKCTGEKSDCTYKGKSYDIKRKIKRHTTSISSVVATKLAAGHNQTATAIFVGKRGKGKSMACGSVMESYASKISVLLGTNPWEAEPEKYFPIKDLPNMGIISEEDIIRALKKMREPESLYNGFILDDVGKFLDAREFMTKKNKITNKIFQTCRTKKVFTGLTIPDDAGLDKDPRENSDYFCIMEQSIHDRGLSVGRLFEQNKQYRSGNMWYVYLRMNGNPIMRHTFITPSPAFVNEYEPKRSRFADDLFDESMLELEKMLAEPAEQSEKKITKRDVLPYLKSIRDGLGKKITTKEFCKLANVSAQEYFDYQAGRFNKVGKETNESCDN